MSRQLYPYYCLVIVPVFRDRFSEFVHRPPEFSYSSEIIRFHRWSFKVKYSDVSFSYATKKSINLIQFQIQMLPCQILPCHRIATKTAQKVNRPNKKSTGTMLSYSNIWLLVHLHLVFSFQCFFIVLFTRIQNAVMKVCTQITFKMVHSNQNALK